MNAKFFLKLFPGTAVFLICTVSFINAQVTQQWVSTYNSPTNGSDSPIAMTVDNSGNVYVTGESHTTSTAKDFTTVKYNSAGVQLWVARYDSPASQDDLVKGIAIDISGNVYVTGSIGFGGSSGVLMTVKYNSSGDQQWAKQLGVSNGSPASAGRGKSPIAIDATGDIYIGGARTFGSGQNSSYVLIKYNENGDSLWSRTYKGTHFLAGLGSAISNVKIDGNFIYVTGKSFDQNPDLSSSTFATTIKYDLSGTQQWIRKDTLTGGSDEVIGMDIDVSGNIILTCNYGFNIVTYKYNTAGARLWKKLYTGISGDHYDEVTGLALDAIGNIYITGNSDRSVTDRDFLTVKYDGSGNQLWDRLYNASGNDGDYSKGISIDAAGNAYITGITFETSFNFDYTTIKYDTDGTLKWKIGYDGGFTNRRDEPIAINLDPSDNVIVTGISTRGVNTEDYATIKYSQTVGINQISSIMPEGYYLSQNYPNPFNPVTNLEFGISDLGFVSLKIYDMIGKEVATLFNNVLGPGTYRIDFDASGLTSGIYFYKLETDNFSATKKMLLIK